MKYNLLNILYTYIHYSTMKKIVIGILQLVAIIITLTYNYSKYKLQKCRAILILPHASFLIRSSSL